MYCAYDGKHVIALHDEKKVVESYVDTIYKYHKVRLEIRKVKRKSIKDIIDLDELYLVRYLDGYIQSEYLSYMNKSSDDFLYEYRQTRDILMRVYETEELNSKESKGMLASIQVMDKLIRREENYIPTYEDLRVLKSSFNPFRYNSELVQ